MASPNAVIKLGDERRDLGHIKRAVDGEVAGNEIVIGGGICAGWLGRRTCFAVDSERLARGGNNNITNMNPRTPDLPRHRKGVGTFKGFFTSL